MEIDHKTTNQKQLLKKLKQHGQISQEYIVKVLQAFLKCKPEKEPLDIQWIEVWPRIRQVAIGLLPNSLVKEMEAAISSIELVDPEVWHLHINESQKTTILLGAGASVPHPSNIPSVANLLPELWRRAKKIGRNDLERLELWCNSHSIQNIEDLLTSAYIANFSAKNNNITALLNYFLFAKPPMEDEEEITLRRGIGNRIVPSIDASSIALLQDTLQTLFGLLTSTMILAKPNSAHAAITHFLLKRPNTRVVTTNYDGCMDEALIAAGRSLGDIAGTNVAGVEMDDVELIKMHGSINWSYCDSCQDIRNFSLPDLKKTFEEDRLSYAVIGICKTCGGQRRPLLVPPLSLKFMMFPNLVGLWNCARRSIEKASLIIVVGYSFSEADAYITKMISRSLTLNPQQRLVVVDANPLLVPAIRAKYSVHIDGFNERRVLQMVGSCDITLPKLLESLLNKS